MNATTTNRTASAVSYERISRFRVTGNGLDADVERGVDRQAADADTYAAQANLGRVRHITDNDRSASEFATKTRDGWADLLAAVRAGEVTHVLVWLLDRAVRQVSDVDDLLRACRDGGAVIVQTGTGSTIDPTNAESRLHAQIAAAVAEYEAAKMSMRQLRRKAEDAAKGRPHGGRRRFGYEPGMTTLRESEAAALRDVIRRLLAGESLYALAGHLNGLGLVGPTGAPWTGPNLRQTLGRPHLAALRVHQGKVIGAATWPSIISEDDHRRVVALLSDPRRRTNPESNARRYLLTGLAVCDACEAPLRSRGSGLAYACATGRHVQRPMAPVDAIVEAFVVGLLSRSNASSLFADDTTAEELARVGAARAAKAAEMTEALALRADGVLTVRAFAAVSADLEAELDALDARLAALAVDDHRSADVMDGLLGAGAAAAWADLSLARRRNVIDRLVSIRLVSRGRGARFTPSDVVITRRTP